MENEEKKPSKIKSFFIWFKNNLMKTTNGMAIGLFGTLIIGTIINLFSKIPNMGFRSSGNEGHLVGGQELHLFGRDQREGGLLGAN